MTHWVVDLDRPVPEGSRGSCEPTDGPSEGPWYLMHSIKANALLNSEPLLPSGPSSLLVIGHSMGVRRPDDGDDAVHQRPWCFVRSLAFLFAIFWGGGVSAFKVRYCACSVGFLVFFLIYACSMQASHSFMLTHFLPKCVSRGMPLALSPV